MTEDDRILCKAVSLLLDYPSVELLDAIEEFRSNETTGWKGGQVVWKCMDYLVGTPLIKLQEEYTATFDLNQANSLNLSYHRWGDGKERGRALAHLSQLYAEAGYEIGAGELPDFFPLLLEFLSVAPPESACEIMEKYGLQIPALADRLAASGSPSAGIVHHAAELFCMASDHPQRRAAP